MTATNTLMSPVVFAAVEGSAAAKVLTCLQNPGEQSHALGRSSSIGGFDKVAVPDGHGEFLTALQAQGTIYDREATLLLLPCPAGGAPLGLPHGNGSQVVTLVDMPFAPRRRSWGRLADTLVYHYQPWAAGSDVYFVFAKDGPHGWGSNRVYVPRKMAENLAALLCRPASPSNKAESTPATDEQPAQLGSHEVCVGDTNSMPPWVLASPSS